MMRIALAAVAAVLLCSNAFAQRVPIPIVDHPNMAIATGSGKPLTLEAVSKAIEAGTQAVSYGRQEKWTIGRVGADRLRLVCSIEHGRHTFALDVPFTQTSYSVLYADSFNLKYGMLNNQRVIHPFYDRWVGMLIRSIDAEFMKL